MPPSRFPKFDTFDPTNQRVRLLFIKQSALLDAELNEQLRLEEHRSGFHQLGSLGDGSWGDAFKVEATSNPNEVLVRPGVLWVDGDFVQTFDDTLLPLTTPGGDRDDIVYVKFSKELVEGTDDPSFIDPDISSTDTASRVRMVIEFEITEGVTIAQPPLSDFAQLPPEGPTAPLGKDLKVFRIATLERLAGDPSAGTIVDERNRLARNYVAGEGLRVTDGGGTTVDVEGGDTAVGDADYTIAPVSLVLPIESERYIFVDAAGTVLDDGEIPVQDYVVPLAKVTTDAAGITDIVDLRTFHSCCQALSDRLDAFAPGSPFGSCIDASEICILRPEPTAPESLQIFVQSGTHTAPSGTFSNSFPGGNTPFFGLPAVFNRIDLVTITESNSLNIIPGVEAPAPIPPTYPLDEIPLAEVTLHPGDVTIELADIRDVRPFINLGGGGAASGVPALYELHIAGAAQTVFNLAGTYTVGDNSLEVYRNGKLLMDVLAYTETGASIVTLLSPAIVGDELLFVVKKNEPSGDNSPFLHELQVAGAAQLVYDLTTGFYRPGTNSLFVYRNGKLLTGGVAYAETNATRVTLLGYGPGLPIAGDEMLFRVL